MLRLIAVIALVGCSDSKKSSVTVEDHPVPVQAPQRPAVEEPSQTEIKRDYDAMTAGAIPGDVTIKFVPAKLGGVERSNLLDQAFASAGAYKLPDGSYANLDIGNTFHRGSHDTSLEDRNNTDKSLCPKQEKVNGHMACVKVRVKSDGGTSIRWYLPDRLTVRIAAPTEELARKMAAELPIAELAKLSAQP